MKRKKRHKNGGRGGLKWVSGRETPSKVYITRVFNFGTWKEWRMMRRKYREAEILDAVKKPLRGEWTNRGKAFAETLYAFRMPRRALISYEA